MSIVGSQLFLYNYLTTPTILTIYSILFEPVENYTYVFGLLIPRSKILFAVLEGYPIDEGVAAEVAYMATNFGPVIGFRTDFRLAENPATGTNPAVTYFLQEKFGGQYFEGPDADENAYLAVKNLASQMLKERK